MDKEYILDKGIEMKRNRIKFSLLTAMVLTSSAYTGNIITDTDMATPNKQFGFGGWNLDNVDVKIVRLSDRSMAL